MFKKIIIRISSSPDFEFLGFLSRSKSLLEYIRRYSSAFLGTALLLFVFGASINAFGQATQIDYRRQLNMPTVVPPSPDAASIEKFGNIPVSYVTGVPDISIPLYTIKCGSLNWPISLSYHAAGIRVDETASSAGLGWTVNATGVISRSKAGRHDEETHSEPVYTSVTADNYDYLYQVLDGLQDSEQDVFNFNFNSRSGKFVINQDSSVLQIPLSNLKITYVRGPSNVGLESFTITDENGITYLFAQQEFTTEDRVSSAGTESEYFVSSWYLTKVEMPDQNNKIQLTYAGAGPSYSVFTTFSHAVGEKYIINPSPLDQTTQSFVSARTDMVKLTGMDFSNGSVVFTHDALARKDVGSGNDATNKLSMITINQVQNGISTQIKKFSFLQSYFYYRPPNETTDKTNFYRLKLENIHEYGSKTSAPKQYSFVYNTTDMVPKENYGQDIWGFNNGQYGNQSLLQTESISFNNGVKSMTFQIGNANRAVDTNLMKACMLSSITYPTGGKTTFTFEPHVYSADQNLTSITEKATHVTGDQVAPQVSTTNFTFPSNALSGTSRVIVDMSKYDFTGVTNPSWVSIKDLTTGALFYVQSQPNPYQRVSWNDDVTLVQGHDYELKAYVYSSTSNPQLTASIKVQWNSQTLVPDIRRGGGLRIKEIKNYLSTGVLAGTETYMYDTAVTLTPFSSIERTYSEVFYRLGTQCNGCSFCQYHYSNVCRVYSSSPVYARSTAMGSFMLYRKVRKFTADAATGATNGMSEYRFDVFRDEIYPVGGRYTYVPLLSNDWMNGALTSETQYKISNGIYSKVKSTEYQYSQFNTTMTSSLRVQSREIHEGCSLRSSTTIASDAFYYTFPIRSGSKRLWKQIETVYDDNQNKMETHTYHEYASSKYDFPTKITLIDSKQKSDSVTFKRSPDVAAIGNVYEKMEQQNILAPVIEQKSYSNATLLNTVKNNYSDWKNDGRVIAIDNVQASTSNHPLETRLKYYDYDTYANPLSVGNADDVKTAYIWGYNYSYPVAQVIGADYATAISKLTSTSVAGLQSIKDDATLRSKLNEIRTGFAGTPVQVTTYTYKPLVGMTSQTDRNGRIMYYAYDDFGRLRVIRDHDNNIIKKFCYNYEGQTETCNFVGNQEKSQVFTRNCSYGFTPGPPVTYTVPANTYYAATQSEADANALADIGANGQSFANANGTCSAVTIYATLSVTNTWSSGTDVYGDVVMRFYSDADHSIPFSVQNLQVNVSRLEHGSLCGCVLGGSIQSFTCTGNEVVIIPSALLRQQINNSGQTDYLNIVFQLKASTGYVGGN